MAATAYYNEIDPKAAAWLRQLIADGHIAPGEVDERSIEDVTPNDLLGYKQCHFFAGIGVWSYALRRVGWPDDRAVWTGSCPCQPFSAAGTGGGFDDERHLWPAWYWLIEQCGPPVLFGEQVASKDVNPWIDLVSTDLEALGYRIGAVAFPSAGVGAPHIRDRTYFAADRLADADLARSQRRRLRGHGAPEWTFGAGRLAVGLADAQGNGRQWRGELVEPAGRHGAAHDGADSGAGAVNGLWRDADWLLCRDGKWRPVEPGTQPLAHGASARVGRLRGYGNAINAEAATAFIQAYLDGQTTDGTASA